MVVARSTTKSWIISWINKPTIIGIAMRKTFYSVHLSLNQYNMNTNFGRWHSVVPVRTDLAQCGIWVCTGEKCLAAKQKHKWGFCKCVWNCCTLTPWGIKKECDGWWTGYKYVNASLQTVPLKFLREGEDIRHHKVNLRWVSFNSVSLTVPYYDDYY